MLLCPGWRQFADGVMQWQGQEPRQGDARAVCQRDYAQRELLLLCRHLGGDPVEGVDVGRPAQQALPPAGTAPALRQEGTSRRPTASLSLISSSSSSF